MTGQRQASDHFIMPRINAEFAPISTGFSGAREHFRKHRRALLAACLTAFFCAAHADAQEPQKGPVSGLPLPRYVSLKSDRVNVREGPSKEHPTLWVYERAALPVEITAEFETWRKIRDSEGSEGWVLHSLLSGRRTALVAPWKKEPQLLVAADHSTPTAKLGPGVIGNLRGCDGQWCRIAGKGFDGYMQQENLWGVYPGEKFE
ncbi:MAG: SH3 domain-containing protein [Methylocystis sp.]|uniref:SH3 domain-containing protein n=1 Tax=Methylocystis sp. TaxID=1911079 RepID=UPI003D138852